MKEQGGEIRIALAGNPNSGKTTLFNALTGSNQYVGNWPGVTVEKKEGRLKGREDVIIQDLPGIYSLSPYSPEEVVARDYLVQASPQVILNIVDGSNLERNLYLTSQLQELGIPMVVAINMMDLVNKKGDLLDLDKLSKWLGCPVVGISALKKAGIDQVIAACLRQADHRVMAGDRAMAGKHAQAGNRATSGNRAQAGDRPMPGKRLVAYAPETDMALKEIEKVLVGNGVRQDQLTWYAVKAFERDDKALEALQLPDQKKELLESIISLCENKLDNDSESIISEGRYQAIDELSSKVLRRKAQALSTSDKIDRVVTHRVFALPIFVGIMFLMYYVAVAGFGQWATDQVNGFFEDVLGPAVANQLTAAGASEGTISLLVDGVIAGIGAPLGFVPQMAMVFLFMGFLEECGYMARVAFIMDRLFRRFGLSGRSFISFMVTTGCGVPGIMATRTIRDQRDRDMTMITTNMLPCSAKLPIISLVAGYMMGGAWWMAPLTYFICIGMVILACIILKKTRIFAGEPAPFVMELPPYHLPSVSGIFRHVWMRIKAFLKKAGTIIFAMCVAVWFLSTYGVENGAFGVVEAAEFSLLGRLGSFIAPIFLPLGFGSWQAVASIIAGFTAKENVVSTMGVLAGVGAIDAYEVSMHTAFSAFFPNSLAAFSFLLFNLFNTPCLAATSTLYREISSKKRFWFAIAFQNLGAYAISLMVYQLAGLAMGLVPFTAASLVALALLACTLYLLFRPDPAVQVRRSLQVD